MKYRMMFAKQERVSFVSHLELMKVFAQAIRRAKLPLATTEGYNPRPKINFSSAIAVGMTSQAECADLVLTEKLDADQLCLRLNQTLPEGFLVKKARLLEGKQKSLMALLTHADYTIELGGVGLASALDLEAKIENFLAQDQIKIEVVRKKKRGEKDIRPGIVSMKIENTDPLRLFLHLRSGSSGHVRPEQVIEALFPDKKPTYMKIDKTMTYGIKEDKKVELYEC